MTAEEFIKEVNESEFSYSSFEEEYKEFHKYQILALNTLNEFCRVCEKNNIIYVLAFGTLLGAIRDQGQIPWDYDIDVLVSIQDRERLIEALKRDLNDDYYFMCPQIDDKCRHFFIKMCPKGYRSLELHVDVFYVVGLPENESESQRIRRELDRCTKIRRIKCRDLNRVWKVSKKSFFRCVYLKIRFMFTSLKSVNAIFEKEAHEYSMQENELCFVPEYKTIYKTKDIFDTTFLKLDSGKYRIPVAYDSLLTQWYGDYNQMLPLHERISEMRTHFDHLVRLAKI